MYNNHNTEEEEFAYANGEEYVTPKEILKNIAGEGWSFRDFEET